MSAPAPRPAPALEAEEDVGHDADLNTFQKTAISLVSPQLLNNVPHPWRIFLLLVILNIGSMGGLVWYMKKNNCVLNTEFGVEVFNYGMWYRALDSDSFGCLRMFGEFRFPTNNKNGTKYGDPGRGPILDGYETVQNFTGTNLKGGAVVGGEVRDGVTMPTRGLAPGEILYLEYFHYIPCFPNADPTNLSYFMRIYFHVTGDLKAEHLWCDEWSPEQMKRERYPTASTCNKLFARQHTQTLWDGDGVVMGIRGGNLIQSNFLTFCIYPSPMAPICEVLKARGTF